MSDGLVVCNLHKSFFGVPVLKGLSLDMLPGKILGLVGENGAGKSTLMNILGGYLEPDAGELFLDGQLYQPRSSRDAIANGIGIVHQELNLFPNLTIAENLFLTAGPATAGWLHRRTRERLATRLLERVGLNCSASTRVSNLSPGQQQLVELSRVLAADFKFVLLDEPTTSLSDRESINIFRIIRELAASGKAILLVTHAISDVLQNCDRVAILRDGELVDNLFTKDIDTRGVIKRMIGRPVSQLFPRREISDNKQLGRS